MRVAVLGAAGMLGRAVCREFSKKHDVIAYVRKMPAKAPSAMRLVELDLSQREAVRAVASERVSWIVNCAGIVKCLAEDDVARTIIVNAALPHWLERLVAIFNSSARILHVSTDCVFSGATGNYREDSAADPTDIYGASKLAGELYNGRSVTLRTSFVGIEEPGRSRGLLSWLLSAAVGATPSVHGYTNAIWSGLSNLELAKVIRRVTETPRPISGLWHVAGERMTKYELLRILAKAFALKVQVIEDSIAIPPCDRSLDGEPFRLTTGWSPPAWSAMAGELAAERGAS